jgi:RNA polymerase sigma-70 factor (ECF subfamily)
MLLHHARRDARVDADGRLVLLADQDRSLWHVDEIEEGRALAAAAGDDDYGVQAAIAAQHVAPVTDWARIAELYGALEPSPVIELNRAVAVGFRDGPQAGLDALARVEGDARLADYYLRPATRADLYRRAGRGKEAAAAYREAIGLVRTAAERRFLERRMRELSGRS